MPLPPQDILADAWDRLRQGQAGADHPFRTSALATADALGRPDARTVVLRRVNPEHRCLDFQTDRRSPKFTGLQHGAAVAWLFYDPAAAIQLRITATAALHTHDSVADDEWAAVPDAARVPYAAPVAPGAILDGPGLPATVSDDGRANFAVVRTSIDSLEYLRREAGVWHRLRFTWPNGECRWQWLMP